MKILIVDDDNDVRFMLRTAVAAEGFEVIEAEDGRQGFESFEANLPDLVITDYMMPHMDGLELLRRIRGSSAESIVVMMTGCGREEVAVQALRLHANNYLRKPIRLEEFVALLSKYHRILEDRSREEQVLGMILSREMAIQFENRIDLVSKIADQLVREAGVRIPPSDSHGIRLGLYEMLMNAIEHGNLGIDFHQKSAALENDNLRALYEARLAEPERAARRVTVEFSMNPAQCCWTIRDEGDGFDWQNHASAYMEGVSDALNGRGIFLTRFQFDSVEYSGRGNEVRLVKNSQRPAEEPFQSLDGVPLP